MSLAADSPSARVGAGGSVGRAVSPRDLVRAALLLAEVLPAVPLHPLAWLTRRPTRQPAAFVGPGGDYVGDLYRPAGDRRRPGVVLFLGAGRRGARDPRAVRLAEGLARGGFATLMCRSTAMLDGGVQPEDLDLLVAAFEHLTAQPGVDPTRTGFAGFCLGAAYTLVAAARPAIAERVSFVALFAPYYSGRDQIRAMGTGRAFSGQDSRSWQIPWHKHADTRHQFEQMLLGALEDQGERGQVSAAVAGRAPEPAGLSPAASAVYWLLSGAPFEGSTNLIEQLPPGFLARLDRVSPRGQLDGLRAETLVIHSANDELIPVEESRRLVEALRQRVPTTYSELKMFEHIDLAGATSVLTLAREFAKLAGDLRVLLRQAG